MKLTASKRIYLSFSVMIFIIMVFGLMSTFMMQKIKTNNQNLDLASELFDQLKDIENVTINFTLVMMDTIIDKEAGLAPEEVKAADEFEQALLGHISEAEKILKEMNGHEFYQNNPMIIAITKNISTYQEAANQLKAGKIKLFEGINQKKDRDFFDQMDNELDAAKDKLDSLIDKDVEELNIVYYQIVDDVNKVLLMAETSIMIGSIAAVILGIILSVLLTRKLMTLLTGITSKLVEASKFTTMSSKEISTSSDSLSSTASEQASAIEETTASLEEISGTIKNNLSETERTSQMSESMKDQSLKASSEMKSLEQAMTDIMASNEEIKKLVQIIANIGDKTKVMDEIVFQTKLLSFNASVEAERAGEHGRGFAVVAQEVGNLAQMSGKAAQEISEILKVSISNADSITKANQEKVVSSNEIVKSSSTILDHINQSATTLADSAKHVYEASKEQEKGIEQINNAMTELDKSTQQNAALAEETAAAGRELATQAVSLEDVVKELKVLIYGDDKERAQEVKKVAKVGKGIVSKPVAKKPISAPSINKRSDVKHTPVVTPAAKVEKDSKKTGPDEWELL